MHFSAYADPVFPDGEEPGSPILFPRDLSRKMVRVMKLTAVFLLAFALHISARGYSQTVTLSFKDAPLSKVFSAIQKETGYTFTYFMEDVAQYKASFTVRGVSIEEALRECLKGLPLMFVITREVKNISIQSTSIIDRKNTLSKQSHVVEGKIIDENGVPIPSATITVKGTVDILYADDKGGFILKDIDKNAVLIVSSVGYETVEVLLKERTEVSINLKRKNGPLDEIQIIAYGSTTERASTGDITTVSAKEISQQPVDNPLLALEGRVPGLIVNQSSGVPGSGITVNIQGINSMTSGTAPFYVVDGVPYPTELLPNLGGPYGILGQNNNNEPNSGGGNPLSYLNPKDIESITVLKDADATAIYGSRAANGAILINTIKGKSGQTKVDFNLQQGMGEVTHMLPLLNTAQYLQMRHEAFSNDGLTPSQTDYDINGVWDTARYTNWQKVLIGGTAQYTNAQASVSGGTANTQFLVSAGYHRQTTVFPGDLADQKGSIHFNVNNMSADRRFNMQLSGSYMYDYSRLIQTDFTQMSTLLPPDAPAVKNTDGSVNWAPFNGNSTWLNPFSLIYQPYYNTTKNLISNLVIGYRILNGLVLKSSFGYNNLQSSENVLSPFSSIPPDLQPYSERAAAFSNGNISTWIVEPQLTYDWIKGKNKLQAIVGSTIEQNTSNQQGFVGVGYNSDLDLQDISAASSVYSTQTTVAVYKYNALFGRVNYNWDNKYIISLNGRRDGSSRFGPQNQFHNFSSISASWIFTQEKFAKRSLPFVSFGKIRGSYGTTGNDQFADYQYLTLYNPISVSSAYQGAVGYLPSSLPNPYLAWEKTNKLQFGLDLGFVKDMILFYGNFYLNKSSNLLQGYALPAVTGNNSIVVNFPATIENSGWELSLQTKNINLKNFNWYSSFNMTIPRNKLVSFPGLASSTYANQYVLGKSINIDRAYPFLGVNSQTGLYQFANSHGDPTSSPSYPTDATYLVNPNPHFFCGLDNVFRYKRFELDVFVHFVDQIGRNYSFGNKPGKFSSGAYGTNGNQPIWVMNAWQKPGDKSSIQRYSTTYPSSANTAYSDVGSSSGIWTDASFVRLKNLSFSWEVPDHLVKNIHMRMLKVYMQGQNLFTLTKFRGMDPETMSITSLPTLRVLTFGLQVGL